MGCRGNLIKTAENHNATVAPKAALNYLLRQPAYHLLLLVKKNLDN
jgi:hypothetical protein